MHPGILVLPILSLALAGALHWSSRRRRTDSGEARATLIYGLIATAFLWPALSIPDGVPSPSASLYSLSPWQDIAGQGLEGAPDPSDGNTALTDVTFQIQPWLLLLRDQVRAGELPLWNPYSFLGQPFWANGQSAPLFPLHLLFAVLPTMWGFLLLPWLRMVIGALGTRRLALALGISPAGATLAGVVFSLSGMVSGYLLFPMANALVMVPWVLWATERLASEGRSWRPLAVCVALLALGGHPGTVSHCALLSAIYLLVRGIPWRRIGAWVLGWATGGALAMVHLLPVALYLPLTARWGSADAPPPGPGPPWTQVLPMTLRIFQPWVYGRSEQGTWHGAFYEPGSRVFVGLVTLLLVLVALQAVFSQAKRRDRRLLAVVVLLTFCALVAYRTPILLGLVESLPIVGRALHHRLLFGVELCLALLAGVGLDRLAAGPVRRLAVSLATLGGGFVVLIAFLVLGKDRPPGEVMLEQLPWIVWLLFGVWMLWLLQLQWLRRRARLAETTALLALVATLAVAAELTVAHAPSAPGLSADQLYPPTGATLFLDGRAGAVAGIGSVLRPGTSMVYGLRDLRGDDPARPRRFDRMYENLGSTRTPFFHPIVTWDHPWLDQAGVRWVMAPPGLAAKDSSWRPAYDGADARVFERPNARPEAWLADSDSDAVLEVHRPSNSVVRIEGLDGVAGRFVVSQAWAPGWRARMGTREVETVAHEDFLLAVDLPVAANSVGAVEFVYRPPGLVLGAWVSLAALLWLLLPPAFRSQRSPSGDLPEGTTRIQGETNRAESPRPAV